ncbi:MAG TPA: hypothetical protein DD437_12540, partial [Rhodobiaceae bacterium]|nr:hypothetical protein [Rhodobiaceae bacterium]
MVHQLLSARTGQDREKHADDRVHRNDEPSGLGLVRNRNCEEAHQGPACARPWFETRSLNAPLLVHTNGLGDTDNHKNPFRL